MTVVVLLVLGILWVVVLAPPVLRYATGDRRRADSVGEFNDTLSVLGRTNGRRGRRPDAFAPERRGLLPAPRGSSHAPGRLSARAGAPTPAQRRRRDILVGLAGAVGVTFLLALVVGGTALWGLQIVADLLLAAYVTLLVQCRQRELERRSKVRYLPDRATGDELALRRAVSGR